jgi:sensor domain CHASE-containing protein
VQFERWWNKLNIVSKVFFFPSWLVKETILLMMFVDDDVQLTLENFGVVNKEGKQMSKHSYPIT